MCQKSVTCPSWVESLAETNASLATDEQNSGSENKERGGMTFEGASNGVCHRGVFTYVNTYAKYIY